MWFLRSQFHTASGKALQETMGGACTYAEILRGNYRWKGPCIGPGDRSVPSVMSRWPVGQVAVRDLSWSTG